MSEFLLILNALLYFTAILFCIKKKKHNVVIGILILYFVSAVGSIFLFGNDNYKVWNDYISFYPLIYLFIMLLLMLRPLMSMKNNMIIELPNQDFLRVVIIIVFLIALPRSIQALINFDDVIGGLLIDPTTASVIEGVSIYDKKSGSGFNYFGIIGGCGYALAPLLLMFYLTQKKPRKLLVIMLLFVSIASALEETAKGGRSALAMFMLSIFFLFVLFRPYYSNKIRKYIYIYGGVFLALLLGVFVLVSMFKEAFIEEDTKIYHSLNYFSQNYLVFDSYGLDANGVRYGTRTATMITKLFDPSSPSTYAERVQKFNYMKTDESKFSTFVGDLTLDFGPFLTAILILILSAVFSRKLSVNGPIPFYKLVLVFFIMKLFLAGLFLSPYTDLGGNLQIIVFFVTYEFFKYNRSKSFLSPSTT